MSTLSELEDLYRRWFPKGHDGLSYRDFVQGIGADLDAPRSARNREGA